MNLSPSKVYRVPVYAPLYDGGAILRFDSYRVAEVQNNTSNLPLPASIKVEAWTRRSWHDDIVVPFENWLQHHLNPHPYMDARPHNQRNRTMPNVSRVVWPDGGESWAHWEERRHGQFIRVTIAGPCMNSYFTVILRKVA